MSHLYDTVEPSLISEALLRECVRAQGPPGEPAGRADDEEVAFADVTQLRLDFKNILCIDNLWQFGSLVKLQLDNNIIECISGLDRLTQLQWLDLSFNNIEVIQGLEALHSLRDLSLAHNRIRELGGCLSSLPRLQVLSLASNLLDGLDQVRALREFPCLQSLALRGNPLASDEGYPSFAVAYIPTLVYLDFRMITDPERSAAREKYRETLEEVEQSERELARKASQRRAREEEEERYRLAYMDGLMGSVLFRAMFTEDTETERLRKMPGGQVEDMLSKLEEEFVQFCEHLAGAGLQERAKREREVTAFQGSRALACSTNHQLSVARVRRFQDQRDKLISEEQVEEALGRLHFDLMQFEMQLVEQLDDIGKDFERNISDLFASLLEQVQSHMTQLRELENQYHESLTEMATETLELFVKQRLDEDLADDLRVLFMDKDTLLSAINGCHDTHVLAIDAKEDSIISHSKAELKALLEGVAETERSRNRRKVAEILQYMAKQREELTDTAASPAPV